MGAMGCAKSVIDIDIAEFGELFRKLRIVLLLFGMEAQILEHQHAARWQIRDHLLDFRSDAVRPKLDCFAKKIAQTRGHRFQAVLRVGLAFRPPEMRRENKLSVLFDDIPNGGERRLYACVIRDLAIGERNVEVHAHKDTAALQIEIRNPEFIHYFITSLMTSRSLQLKPHSLSYQENTLTSRSPIAFVSGPSTIEE